MPFFENIIGHHQQTKQLSLHIERNIFAHAYLFIGPDSIGKTHIALTFAQNILRDGDQSSCQSRNARVLFQKKIHPDIHLVTTKDTVLSVKTIRAVIQTLSGTHQSRYRIVIIPDAHKMTINATNSLLKTLEEPSQKNIIILTTHNTSQIPMTISSRCQIFRFNRVRTREIIEYLVQEMGISQVRAEQIARISQGRIGDAIRISRNSTYSRVIENNVQIFFQLLSGSIIDKIKSLNDIYFKKNGDIKSDSIAEILRHWQYAYHDIFLQKLSLRDMLLFTEHENQTKILADNTDLNSITNSLEKIQEAIHVIETTNSNQKLLLENIIISL